MTDPRVAAVDPTSEPLHHTPLAALHRELGGRMVPFAGWALPVQYPTGIVKEHEACRHAAALFDVAHMGLIELRGPAPAAALERLVPGDIAGLATGRARYTQLTTEGGGIIDDLIAIRADDHLLLVVNAANREHDLAHLRAGLPGHEVTLRDDLALLALQGPAAAAALASLLPEVATLPFMGSTIQTLDGAALRVSRMGYTGEDGFELAVPAAVAERVARRLLALAGVVPAGLGARDTLRLEAALPLHGQDITASTTPVEAGLAWSIPKRRRVEGGFPGAEVILRQLAHGSERRRIGIRPEGKAVARTGTEIADAQGRTIGTVTSGGYGPTVGGPIALGMVEATFAEPGRELELLVRGRVVPAETVALPFVSHRYKR